MWTKIISTSNLRSIRNYDKGFVVKLLATTFRSMFMCFARLNKSKMLRLSKNNNLIDQFMWQ
jgi:hypothetical protein